MSSIIFDLMVRNHPGAMSHITGLFARRAFNLEAIRCAPAGDGSASRMLLLVSSTSRLEQIKRQLARLYDVLSVDLRDDLTGDFFRIDDAPPLLRLPHAERNVMAPARLAGSEIEQVNKGRGT